MSVFYSFSNHRETKLHKKHIIMLSNKLENIIIDVDTPNNQNSHQLLDKINNWIESLHYLYMILLQIQLMKI